MEGVGQPRFERLPDEELIRLALEAIGDRDAGRLGALVADDVRVRTGRGLHEGRDAVDRWAQKRYEHLDRRWALDELRPLGEGWLGRGRAEYAWREDGRVADSTPAWFSFRLGPAGLTELGFHDEEAAARAALGG